MSQLGIALLVLGGMALFFALGLREYGRRDPAPNATAVQTGESIRRRRGETAASTYWTTFQQTRRATAARWPAVSGCGALLVVVGASLLIAG